MYVTIRSQIHWIFGSIGLELSGLSALELEKLPYLTLFSLYLKIRAIFELEYICSVFTFVLYINQSAQTWSKNIYY